jgi:transposase
VLLRQEQARHELPDRRRRHAHEPDSNPETPCLATTLPVPQRKARRPTSLSRREQLVRARSRSKNEIHAVLVRRLVGRPPASDLFGVKGRKWLAELSLPLEESETIEACLRHIEFLDSEIAAVERQIATQALDSPEIRRLMTVPGVNVICAASFMAAVGEIGRFQNPRALTGYLGLDPRVYQSGSAPATGGHISRQGSASARWALVEAARSFASPARCMPSTRASARGVGMGSPSWRARASSHACSGSCSPAARTTPTSSPR